jgi:hypothetical protein
MTAAARNESLSAALEELAAAGIHHPTVSNGGKHMQVRWQTPRGQIRIFSVACTPSEWRASANTRSDVRRILRQDGMLEEAIKVDVPTKQPSRIDLLERRIQRLEHRLALLERRSTNGR